MPHELVEIEVEVSDSHGLPIVRSHVSGVTREEAYAFADGYESALAGLLGNLGFDMDVRDEPEGYEKKIVFVSVELHSSDLLTIRLVAQDVA